MAHLRTPRRHVDDVRTARRPARPTRGLAVVVVALGAAVACSSASSSSTATTTAVEPAVPTTAAPPTDLAATTTTTIGPLELTTSATSLGELVVDGQGMTLYAQVPGREDACSATCLEAWPRVEATSLQLAGDLDPAVFTLTEIPGDAATPTGDPIGAVQATSLVTADGRPLHRFIGDVLPGDTVGQGFNAAFYVVTPAGALLEPPPASTTTTVPP